MLYNNSAGGGASGGVWIIHPLRSMPACRINLGWRQAESSLSLSHSLAVSTCWAPAATFSYSII